MSCGSSCAHYQNKLEKNNIWRLFWRESMGKTPPKKLEKTNKRQYLETLWESSIDKIKKTSRNPKKQKKQNFSENVWSEAHVRFFLVLPSFFFCFLLVLTLKKLKKLKVFCFLDKMMVKEVWKTKKTQGFFLFLGVCGFSFFLAAQWKNKTKISHFFNHHFIQKNKKPRVFFSFFKVKTKKTKKPRQNQKKQNMSLRPNILWKVLFFCFFGFLDVLVILYFLRFNPNQ